MNEVLRRLFCAWVLLSLSAACASSQPAGGASPEERTAGRSEYVLSDDVTVCRVRARFPEARVVVPGHGLPGGPELLAHTRALLDAAFAAKPDGRVP